MIKKLLLSLSFIFCFFTSTRSFGQTAADSAGLKHVTDNYYAAIGQSSRLYNGPEYDFYDPNIKGNAYFTDVDTFSPGNVIYDGISYSNVPMLYDLYKDAVVVLLYNKFSKFTLIKNRVQSFDLLNHHFVYIQGDSANVNKRVATGFYDQLYGGIKVDVLVKRTKSIQNTSGVTTIETYFTSSKDTYLKKGENYYSVSSQSAVLNVLKDKKKELQQYIKENKIKYKTNPEQAIVIIAAHYDELTN